MLKGLAGKTVLITGAAGNIGAETVKPFIEESCNVVASDISAATCIAAADVKGAFLSAQAVVRHGGVDPERRGALLPRRDLHRRRRHDGLTRASGEPGP